MKNPSSRSQKPEFIAKPDQMSTTLIYPIYQTTEPGSSQAGLTITANAGATLGQSLLQVQSSAGTVLSDTQITGGFNILNNAVRAYNSTGGSYASLDYSTSSPFVHLPDGASAQGVKEFFGFGAPSSDYIGTASTDDVYYCLSASRCIAASHTTGTGATFGCGSGTLTGSKDLAGTAIAGDLLIVCSSNTNASETMTIGADAAVTAAAGDGGITFNDGTRYLKFWSHVIQSGDITSGHVNMTSSSHTTGTGRRLNGWIFRHPDGWTTTGSLHGCATYATNSVNTASGTADITVSLTAPSSPSVIVAGQCLQTANNPTVLWDAANTGDTTSEIISASLQSQFVAKPGIGVNTSATMSYPSGGSSVVFGSSAANAKVTGIACWKPNGTTRPIKYKCTSGGSPGTWSLIING